MPAKPFNFYDLEETLRAEGCAICTLTARDVARSLDAFLYEYVNTPETHARIRASRGFCATHSAQLQDYGAQVLGIAILHAAALDEVLALAREASAENGRGWGGLGWGRGSSPLAERLKPLAPCPACTAMEMAEALHIQTLLNHLDESRLSEAYAAGPGLCLPHVRAALSAGTPAQAARLLALQTPRWQALKDELEAFADAYDVNRARGPLGAAADSWRRALGVVAGLAAVWGLRRK